MIETNRLIFQKIALDDFDEMKRILQNKSLMLLGWGKTYSDEEVTQWINKINEQYRFYGYSYWLVKTKSTHQTVGIMGALPTIVQEKEYVEIAYIVKKDFQGHGFAVEGMKGILDFLDKREESTPIIAQFVPENTASQKVAEKLDMTSYFSYNRDFNGEIREHLVYTCS